MKAKFRGISPKDRHEVTAPFQAFRLMPDPGVAARPVTPCGQLVREVRGEVKDEPIL
jgi:hypothetical protein